MYHAAVIYAPPSPEMKALHDLIVGKLPRERFEVVGKEAAQASIPDLTASDLVLLGSASKGTAPVDESFGEILRALQGISLAGRTVGVFALRSDGTLEAFAKALEDCETLLKPGNFLMLTSAESAGAALGPWLDNLIEQLEAQRNER